MLEGKNVDLRAVEKDDLPLLAEWEGNLDFASEYNPLRQPSKADVQKYYDSMPAGEKWFFIESKDGTKVGFITHFLTGNLLEIGFVLIPTERGKGYCTEAVQLMVDYLFLSKDIVRIQAGTHVQNIASQKVLEKSGFKREGLLRKTMVIWGKWADSYVYSILREEWKEPKILTRAKD